MDLEKVQEFVKLDHGLATVSVSRADGSVHSSVVNAGVMNHPVSGMQVVAMVVLGGAFKLKRWRTHPAASVVFRAGWQWVGVEGEVTMFGPADPLEGIDPSALATVLRDVFTSAGGTHDDWDEYDRVMHEEGRTAVFVTPTRLLGVG